MLPLVRTFRLVSAAFVLVMTVAVGEAAAQYKVDTWNTDQGLPQSTVINVTQTPDGFIWLATLGGLARFDGVRFRVFDTATNPELPNSRLGAVFAVANGDLLVLTQDRDLLRFHDGKFAPMGTADGLAAGRVNRISRDRGRLVVETAKGVAVENDDAGHFSPDRRPGPPPGLGLNFVGAAPDGARWFVDAKGVGHRYQGDRLTRTVALPSDRGNMVYEDAAGRLWMRAVSSGELLCVIGETLHRYGPKDGVPQMSTLWTYEERDGTIWFAEAGGLIRFRDGAFRRFTKADGLPDNMVHSVYRDREGSLWVCTERGLARLVDQPITAYSQAQGLAAKNTYPVLRDRRGDIWIGGWPGLTRYHAGRFEHVFAGASVDRLNILSIGEARDGAIYLGLYGGGVRRLMLDADGAPTGATVIHTGLAVVYAIYADQRGDLWFGGDEGAVRHHDGVFDPPLPHTTGASAFQEDAEGALWIGTAAGLTRYSQGAVSTFDAANGFTGKRVRMIYARGDGTLWFGTYDSGLFRYHAGTFTRLTTAEGLPANGAFQILEDAQARFWISSNSGLYRVAVADLDDVAAGRRRRVTAVRYGHDDGMLNQECNGLGRPAGAVDVDGRFWFPTQDGVAVVDPRTPGRAAPPVTILDAAVGGVPVAATDRIEIRGPDRSLDIRYAALTFVRPELAQFKYRLEDLESEWHDDMGIDRTARYARLPYGHFRFHVIAANRDGMWNDIGATIAVVVVPPFWRTPWFMALMAGVMLASVVAAHRLRLRVIERKQLVQQAFARQLLDSQETDRRRIAAELHDGVSQTLVVIKNWARSVDQALTPDHAARRKVTDIESAAAQALGEVREVVQDLVPYHLERMGLPGAIRDAAARVADASGLRITCDLADVTTELSPDTCLKMYRVAQEGLNNIVKHAGASSAAFELALEPGQVRLTMRDDGRGFDPDAVVPTTAGDGFGLVGMQERARMMGGRMTVASSPGRGTAITIVVPVSQ